MDYSTILTIIITIITTSVSVASVIAKVTPNETDNLWVSRIQKFVDALAMSSKPTEFKKTNLKRP